MSDAFKDGDEFVLRLLRNCAGARADQITILCLTLGEDVVPKPRDIRPEEAILRSGGSLVGVEAYRELVLETIRERGVHTAVRVPSRAASNLNVLVPISRVSGSFGNKTGGVVVPCALVTVCGIHKASKGLCRLLQ